MLKERIFVSVIIISLIVALFWVINKYETQIQKQQFNVPDGVKTSFTSKEIIEMIKKLPYYQGDSIIIYDNGTLRSMDPGINGALYWNLNDAQTRQYLENIAKAENLPLTYVVYRHVIPYYIQEKKQKETKQ